MTSIPNFGVGKTNDIVYNAGGKKLDLYRIENPKSDEEIILYIHGGYFIGGTEENPYAQDCAEKFNGEGYNVISMAYTLQTEQSYTYATGAGGFALQQWWIMAVISATNDVIDAIEYIKNMGISKINIVGYSAGATAALLACIGPNPFTQYGLKSIPDRSIIHTLTAIAGSLTVPTDDPTSAHEYLDKDSPTMMLWIGTIDQVVLASGAVAIKDKYDALGRSSDCTLNLLQGLGHANIWTLASSNL